MRLRVIAGALGSRQFETPNSFMTHPMGERIRGSLFNALGSIVDKQVLDPFSGSGALCFEALSRGAAHVVAIERDRRAQQVIERNMKLLSVQKQMTLIKGNCKTWSQQNADALFDLIFCDPPYDNLQLSTISLLTCHLNNNGLMVLSYPGRESAPTVNGVVVVDNSYFGDAALAYYRKAAL